ncbi:MAG: Cadherin-like beta sandwich domain protein [Pelotomaculum sp. PtaB.Bin104]|nr:MAG: Cadherin-like beta sandwich domain protein [Pelotomaculum sp. PtaB.Bin104]
MKLKRAPLIFFLALIMVLQGAVLGLTAFAAGTNLPYVTEYGLFDYVDSNTVSPSAIGTVITTGCDGATYVEPPWPTLIGVPPVFESNVVIGIKFAVNVATPTFYDANITKFHMYDASNNEVAINVKRAGDGTSTDINRNYLYVTPQNALQPSTTYKITVDPTLTSNNTQQAGIQQEVSFSTTAAPDTTAPSVSSSDPVNGATGVAIDKTVVITFSEDILTGDSYEQISVKDGSNSDVPFTKSISGSVLSLDPSVNLGYSSTYTVTVPAGAVKDTADNDLTGAYTLTFTTAAPMAAPLLSGATTSIDGSEVILTFSKAMADPSANAGQFTVNVNGTPNVVTGAALNADPTKIELTLTTAVTYGQAVTVAYNAGTIASADGGVLASFSAQTVTNTLLGPDQSAASAALSPIGSKTAGASFAITITGALDTSGTILNGSNAVTVTNGATVLYSGNVTFTAGGASVTIPASSTSNSITTAGTYTLTVAIAGVTPQPTVPLTITAATQIDSTLTSAAIDQALGKGATRTITVTLRDKFGNPIPNLTKNLRTNVVIANNYTLINESYVVDGETITATGLTAAKSVTTNANGQYTVSVVMPDAIDPGDGVSVQIAQNNGTSFYGSPFAYYEPIPTPVVSSAATSNATHIMLIMDQPLLGTVADTGAFTIHGAATNPTVTNAIVSGTNVTLTLNAAIGYGETITLDYTKSGTNDLNNGPASQVANFTNQPVTNNVPEHAEAPIFVSAASNVQGNVITVTFDKEMAALPAAPDGFSVIVDGVNDVVTALANNTDKTKIELLLTTAINYGQTVTLSYSPGTVTALDGGILAGFSGQTVANNVIQDGYITTLLGDGTADSTGDNGPAALARIAKTIFGCTVVDSIGNIYISDSSNGKVREIAAVTHTQFGINMTAGNIYTVAGTGDTRWGYNVADEGKPATVASIKNGANGIAVDAAGNLYIADSYSSRIREVANTNHTQYGIAMASGCIYTIAGVGDTGIKPGNYTTAAQEEGVAATTAHLSNPNALVFDAAGNLYINDQNNNRIRKMDTSGIITTVAGTGNANPTADSGPATSFNMRPETIAFDSAGNLFIGDLLCGRIYKMDTSGNITTYAGMLIPGGSSFTTKDVGSAPPLTEVGFRPANLVFDSADNLYVAEGNWNRVRKIGVDGSVTLVAGFGYAAGVTNVFNGDNIPATTALLNGASSAPLDKWGNMYILDNQCMRLRFVKNPQVVVVPPPVVSSAETIDQTHIGLTMSRALLGTAVNPAAFTVTGAASNPTVTAAAISGTSVTLTLSSAIAYHETITLSYTKTGHDSSAGYSNLTAVDNFTNQAVTNTIAASSDANLSNLTLSEGTLTPVFDSATKSYTASVGNSVTSITVTPATSDSNATVTVNGTSAATPVELNVGDNAITVSVTSQDGTTTSTYTITVTRARLKGDVNGDNNCDVLDVVKTVNIVLVKIQPTADEFNAADVNNDGVVNVLDVVNIVNIILDIS